MFSYQKTITIVESEYIISSLYLFFVLISILCKKIICFSGSSNFFKFLFSSSKDLITLEEISENGNFLDL